MIDFAYLSRQHLIHEPPFSERSWAEKFTIRLWERLGWIETPNWDVLKRFG